MSRIAAVVLNSVSHDARVLKEAASLAAAGHEVRIFGIQDNRCDDPITLREEGFTIERVNFRAVMNNRFANLVLWLGAGGVLVFVLGAFLFWDAFWEWVPVAPWQFIAPPILGLVLLRYVMRLAQAYRSRAEQLSNDPPPQHMRLSRRVVITISRVLAQASMSKGLLDAILDWNADVIHCHDLNTLDIGHLFKKKTGRLLVYDSHELYEEQSMGNNRHKRTSRAKQRRYSGDVDGFVTINDSIAKILGERYPKLPKAVIVRNAAKRPVQPVEYDGRLHEAAQLDPGVKVLLYQGGFARNRGLDKLVSAAPLLPEGWVLVMMGWGQFEQTLKRLAERLDPVGKHVRFLPGAPQTELRHWTAGASLEIIPYENVCLNHWFCTPNKLWEYPVAGVPILASPFPEMQKIIEENEIGVLLDDPPSPEFLARTVSALSDEKLQSMKQRCADFVAHDNWELYEERLQQLYSDLFQPGTNAHATETPLRGKVDQVQSA